MEPRRVTLSEDEFEARDTLKWAYATGTSVLFRGQLVRVWWEMKRRRENGSVEYEFIVRAEE